MSAGRNGTMIQHLLAVRVEYYRRRGGRIALRGVAAAQGPAPIFTKNAALRLPVQLDERSRADVAELKLFVRGPNGRWECASPPRQRRLRLTTGADGRRVLVHLRHGGPARQGVAGQRRSSAPHRKVVVDSTAPEFPPSQFRSTARRRSSARSTTHIRIGARSASSIRLRTGAGSRWPRPRRSRRTCSASRTPRVSGKQNPGHGHGSGRKSNHA